MSKEPEDLSTTLSGCGLLIVMAPFMIMANAMALSYGWNSVIVPVFDIGLINAYQAYGLSCVVSYLTAGDLTAKINMRVEDKGKNAIERMVNLAVLGFGRPLFFIIEINILLYTAGDNILF